MAYKTTNGLMKHLRDSGIQISGSKQKNQLMNTGYFHGYKGYRFFTTPSKRIPFTSYKELYATIQYDTKLKALFYDKIMFIETAVKNYALECILNIVRSENIQEFFDKAVLGYNNAPTSSTPKEKKKYQKKKLNLQTRVQSILSKEYEKDNSIVTHFFNDMSYESVPLWALFEILMLGDFAMLLSSLTYNARNDISNSLGLKDISVDTNRDLVYKYLYALKDLRNAIAHNSPVFDTRFATNKPTQAMEKNLIKAINLPYVNFKTIGDYVILVCYYLKNLGVTITEIRAFIKEFEKITGEYIDSVSTSVSNIVIHPDLKSRIAILKTYVG
ncbi:MAG: Abi family protein [Candidatus Ornithospirochaeta sp.]